MNRLAAVLDKAQDKANELGARAMLTAVNATGRFMTTRAGKARLAVLMRK